MSREKERIDAASELFKQNLPPAWGHIIIAFNPKENGEVHIVAHGDGENILAVLRASLAQCEEAVNASAASPPPIQ